jgi:hypothetical protein
MRGRGRREREKEKERERESRDLFLARLWRKGAIDNRTAMGCEGFDVLFQPMDLPPRKRHNTIA